MFASAPSLLPVPVRTLPLLMGGDVQTRITLRVMRDLAGRALRDPVILDAAVQAVRGVDGRDVPAQIAALRSWLARRIQFLRDPDIEGDVLRTPRYLLDHLHRDGVARADCDDVSMLTAALGKSIGIPARFHAVAFEPRGAFRHVFTELQTPDGAWHEMDITESAERRAQFPALRSMIVEV